MVVRKNVYRTMHNWTILSIPTYMQEREKKNLGKLGQSPPGTSEKISLTLDSSVNIKIHKGVRHLAQQISKFDSAHSNFLKSYLECCGKFSSLSQWSEVAQPCATLCNLMDCSLPGSSVHGIFPGKSTGVGSLSLLPGNFPTWGLNLGLPHRRQTLYPRSHQGSPP